MNTSRSFSAAGLCLAAISLTGVSLFGAIPSCEKEIAAIYPPALDPSLSACRATDKSFKATAAANISKFTKRLNGTWELSMRTVQGITVDTRAVSARLYFDLATPGNANVTGVALLLEKPKESMMRNISTSKSIDALGFWDIKVSQRDKMSLTLSMAENPGGSFESSGSAIKLADFAELEGVFTSIAGAKPEDWDRIILTDNSLMRVSCRRGVVERYTKVSGQTPHIDGMPVKLYWQKLKNEPLIAVGDGE